MADPNLLGIARNIIENIASEATQNIGSVWHVTRELSELEETISRIKTVLLVAEKKNHNDEVRISLEKLEDVLYEADDLMDDFSPEALQRQLMSGSNIGKKVRTFFSSSNPLVFRWIMAHKIKDINNRLVAINKSRTDFHLEVRHEESRVVLRDREQTHSYIPENEVIGRESDRKAILDLLLDPRVEEDVSVLAIVGMGGLGKTTLAQLVFHDEEVEKNFELKMWVCASEDFALKSLVEKIIKSATDKSPGDLEMDQLRKQLQNEINGKRYFLVLDDVWNENQQLWADLKNLLSNGAKGSRIMITTRSKVVAAITINSMKPYMLGVLDKDESWSLFKNVAFRHGQEPNNPNTRKTAEKIVDKCGGIPLAIRKIGGMLYSIPEAEWSSFLEMEFSRMFQGNNDILFTLQLSYANLPSHLRSCFAYCSLFPKECEIEVGMLIRLWMAQGFIESSSPGQSLEEAGFEIFDELHSRSFFQDVKENYRTKKLECKMHDLMHDLALLVASTKCATLHSGGENVDGRTRHVSFDFDLDASGRFPTFLSKKNRIRTILFPQQSWNSNMLNWDVILLGLKVLRALDLHDSRLKTVPNSIGKLKHLRYLDLSSNGDIKTLPNSITTLQNLQTLKLSFCYSFQEFPRDFNKLVNLRHLENDGCDSLTHMPSGLGKLIKLRTLNNFVLEKRLNGQFSGGLKELMKLNNLRGQLSIRNLRHGEDACAEYENAKLNEKRLHHLKLCWSTRSSDDVGAQEVKDYEITLESLQPHPDLKGLSLFDYWGVRLPKWLPSLTQLDTLCLRKCHKIEHLLPVTQLPFLKSLELFKMYCLQYISNDEVTSPTLLLSTLQSLELRDLPILKGWWKDDLGEEEDIPPFKVLSKLIIRNCPKLTSNMPLYPYLEGELELTNNNRLKTFRQTQQMMMKMKMKMKMMNSFSPFSKLTSLKVERMENLQSLSEVLTSLISLKYLSVGECPKLKFLCHGIQHLVCLQELQISNCQGLVDIYEDGEGNMWQALKSLRILEFSGLPKLETLPEGLQQLTSLEKLSLYRCKSLVGIPQWIHNLKSLQELHIWGSDKLISLPKEGKLTSLHTLTIGDCLFYNCDEDFYRLDLQSLRILELTNLPQIETLPAFLLTSLRELRLHYCNSFVGIPVRIFDNVQSLLQKLDIWGSDKLTSLPVEVMHGLTSLQQLSIRDCPNYQGGDGDKWQALQSLRFLHLEDLPQLVSLPAGLQEVTSLEKLTLDCCKNLVGIPEWIGNLKLLQELTISGCSDNLTSLHEGMRALTSLQELYISHCLFYKGERNMWQGLKSLRILWFSDLPQLEILSNGLQQLTSLQELRLYNCNSLVGIPEWIGNLKSLQTLTIWGCSNLTSLPKGMRHLTSLQTLSIRDCPVLKQRCERQTGGKDWHKVSHIPSLHLFGAQLQPSTSSSAAHGKIFKSVRKLQLQ